ncbi:HEPN domain-containing protein [uncultured Nostoc sp.]|uniref:HEPN domain-containing protein n=1 Tax=uncultured Nostoc sp. TaxID=340711 RepID=UPI0035C9485A
MVQAFVERKTSNEKCITSLVKQKVIERQYHTYFEWDAKNAKKFFRIFCDEFKNKLELLQKIKKELRFYVAIKAFLELGNIRNCLVHQNFANYTIDKTAQEVYDLYQEAMIFVRWLSENFENS